MAPIKEIEKYKCLVCGDIKKINSPDEITFIYCMACQQRANHRRLRGQRVIDYKTLREEFENVLIDFRQLIRQANYSLRKIEDMGELVAEAKSLRERIEIQHSDLVHSLNEQIIKGD